MIIWEVSFEPSGDPEYFTTRSAAARYGMEESIRRAGDDEPRYQPEEDADFYVKSITVHGKLEELDD